MNDRRQSTLTPISLRSSLAMGGKYCSQNSGSTNLGTSSRGTSDASRICHELPLPFLAAALVFLPARLVGSVGPRSTSSSTFFSSSATFSFALAPISWADLCASSSFVFRSWTLPSSLRHCSCADSLSLARLWTFSSVNFSFCSSSITFFSSSDCALFAFSRSSFSCLSLFSTCSSRSFFSASTCSFLFFSSSSTRSFSSFRARSTSSFISFCWVSKRAFSSSAWLFRVASSSSAAFARIVACSPSFLAALISSSFSLSLVWVWSATCESMACAAGGICFSMNAHSTSCCEGLPSVTSQKAFLTASRSVSNSLYPPKAFASTLAASGAQTFSISSSAFLRETSAFLCWSLASSSRSSSMSACTNTSKSAPVPMQHRLNSASASACSSLCFASSSSLEKGISLTSALALVSYRCRPSSTAFLFRDSDTCPHASPMLSAEPVLMLSEYASARCTSMKPSSILPLSILAGAPV
mmetsp:Transcript_28741/g.68643  ORF Transcript_28741/g.68643 Transcript_28741/m.68643 type:complete len:470 (+) Transcript_28741:2753-4162(+)